MIAIDIYVVDDGSTDGSSEAIRAEFPTVNVIHGNGELWYTEGTNVGIRAALKRNPDFVLAINDDSVFDADFLSYLVDTAQRHPRSVVGPLLLLWDEPHRLFQVSPVWDTLYGGWRHWEDQTVWTVPDRPWNVDIIVGNCVLVPAAAFAECGLMDSKRYINFGDAEFTPRLKRQGWDLIIDPRARVFCQPNTPPPSLRDMKPAGLYNALIRDRGNTHNLIRRFHATMDGAPTALHGVAAFTAFLFRLSLRQGRRDPTAKEDPISQTFGDRVIN